MAVVAVIVVVLVIAFFVTAQFAGSNDPFRAAAAGLGLKHSRTVPELLPNLEGMVNGLPVRIDVPKQGATVRYRVFYPPLGMALRLERETTISRTMADLGQADTQVGEATFDNTFKVNTSRPDALKKMMTADLRSTLVQLLETYPRLIIEDGGMTYSSDTPRPDHQEIIRTATEMSAAAHQLVSRRPPPLQEPHDRETPRPQEAKPAAAPATPDPTPQPAAASTDSSPPPPGPRKEAPAPRKQEAVAKPAPPPPPVPTPDTGLPEGFFEDAFGANRLSFETNGKFEEEYQGKEVSLSGTVKQAREVDDDNTVRVGPSTKATVTVAAIDNDLYGKTEIDAIVFFPPGMGEKLDRGEMVDFSGTLETIDPFMRNLFITEARLHR